MNAPSPGPVVLEARNISKSFPGVKALDRVDLTLRAGEVHALTGENGSGKSTLSRVVAGLLQPDEGQLFIDGKEVALADPADAIRRGIVMRSMRWTGWASMCRQRRGCRNWALNCNRKSKSPVPCPRTRVC